MQNYTPLPVKLSGDIELPQDVIDDVVVGTVNPAFQEIADGVEWLNQDTAATVWRGYFDTGTYADDATIGITGTNAYPSGTWSVSSEMLVFPKVGVYSVVVRSMLTVDTTTDNFYTQLRAGIASGAGADTEVTGIRYSTSAAAYVVVEGSDVFNITDLSTDRLRFYNRAGFDVIIDAAPFGPLFTSIIVTYLGPAT